jgi:hypothetical protein
LLKLKHKIECRDTRKETTEAIALKTEDTKVVQTQETTTDQTEAEEATTIATRGLEITVVTEFNKVVIATIAMRKTTDTNGTTAQRDVIDPGVLEVADQEAEIGLRVSKFKPD